MLAGFRDCLADLREEKALIEAEIQVLLHVNGFDLLIQLCSLLLFLLEPQYWHRVLALECLHVGISVFFLSVEKLLLLEGDYLFNLAA